MKVFTSIIYIVFFLPLVLPAVPREIIWSHIGQKHEINKGEDFYFIYDKKLPKTMCIYIEAIEKPETIIFELKTNCVPAPDTIIVPEVILVGCDGELTREFSEEAIKGTNIKNEIVDKAKARFERTIIWTKIGQQERIKNCELVTFVYTDNVPKEDIDFVYETIDGGYILTLVQKGFKQTLEFNCICKTYIVSNPEAINLRVNKNLIYEQIIWTPIGQSLWEVRIGTTNERNCKSPARENLKFKRLKDSNYEKNLPTCQ